MSAQHALCTWDFTISEEYIELKEIISFCKAQTKKYCFQLEKGNSGYLHYQGRISLKTKKRKMIGLLHEKCHWSPTSNENRENEFYVMKNETREKGPWTDRDSYIPKQVRNIELLPWQADILNSREIWDTRTINILYDKTGNIGKSTLATYGGCRGLLRNIPVMNEYRDIMRMIMDTPENKLYLIDFPRALTKQSSAGFWSAIETIKNGYAYDDRYSFREKYFDCPQVWVFTNVLPHEELLSKDRWKYWRVVDGNLQPFTPSSGAQKLVPTNSGDIEI